MSKFRFVRFALLVCAGALLSMTASQNNTSQAAAHEGDPLVHKWGGKYGGVPPFDQVKVADFKPALETGMAEKLVEVDKITANTEAPTFENTIAALETTGSTLER